MKQDARNNVFLKRVKACFNTRLYADVARWVNSYGEDRARVCLATYVKNSSLNEYMTRVEAALTANKKAK